MKSKHEAIYYRNAACFIVTFKSRRVLIIEMTGGQKLSVILLIDFVTLYLL